VNKSRTGLEDRKCVITTNHDSNLVASHLVPGRIGDTGIAEIIRWFVGQVVPADIDRHYPILGVLHSRSLDVLVDTYKVGFLEVGMPVGLVFSRRLRFIPQTSGEPICTVLKERIHVR